MMGTVVYLHGDRQLNRCVHIFDRLMISATLSTLSALAIMLADISSLQAQSQDFWRSPTPHDLIVTTDNFDRAETDRIFAELVKRSGLGRLIHNRELPTIDSPLVRPNRDTLASGGVFDLNAGPVTITLPDVNERFVSMFVIDENHYIPVISYGAGIYTLSREQIGTRYIYVGLRILLDPGNARDVRAVYALQDAIQVEQEGGPGTFQVPTFDPVSRMRVHDVLFELGRNLVDTKRMFGAKDQVDPVRHLIGTAIGFGSTSEKEVLTLHVTPPKNDGVEIYKLTVKDVPVDGFWSVSVYNAEGHFVKNLLNAYTVNSTRAEQSDDGSVPIQFGGCDGKIANCLPTTPGWNYLVRLYRPRPEILEGTWTFPEAQRLH